MAAPALRHQLVTIFGGSGFVGRYLVKELAQQGARIRVVCRHPSAALELTTSGSVGQVVLQKGNLKDTANLKSLIAGSDIVINLVGILYESCGQRFAALHAQATEKLAQAAREAGVRRFIQMSALGVDKASQSAYARTKMAGEKAVSSAFPGATIVRPSVIFGAEDQFINRFAAMLQHSPVMPLVEGGHTRFQPVYVGDVARAISAICQRPETSGYTYELGGPHSYSLHDIICWIQKNIGKERPMLSLPFFVARPLGKMMEFLPKPPLTADQVTLLRQDNVLSGALPGLKELSITPTTLESIAPQYLELYREGGRFAA